MDLEPDLETAASRLEASGHYKVLRKVDRPISNARALRAGERTALIIDTETTGLDTASDEVIEIGLISFVYDELDQVGDVLSTFSGMREPARPVSPAVERLTGISNGMLKGQRLDLLSVERLVSAASLLIAHNAAFDRPICEKLSPVFATKPWACSATEIDWKALNFDGSKLGYLINQAGMFFDAHRALDDCCAVLKLLAIESLNPPPMRSLLASARQTRIRIWVAGPFELREHLRFRGFRWNPGDNGRPRAWWTELSVADADAELKVLQSNEHLPPSTFHLERVTAFERYRAFTALSRAARDRGYDTQHIP